MQTVITSRRFFAVLFICALVTFGFSTAAAQAAPQRSPSETVREFYKAMREKRFRDAWALSIYQPAVEGLSPQEYEDLLPDFEKTALAVTQKVPANLQITNEVVNGDAAVVMMKVLDADDKEKLEQATLIKTAGGWILGDAESQAMVRKAGKKFFFNARIDAHHNDVQDMLTRISLAQVVHSQQNGGLFGDMAALVRAGLVPKDIETPDSTGYRFRVSVTPDRKSWSAAAEPAEYGRSGKLSFYLDPGGVRSADVGGKPLPTTVPKN
ncbi:MAG TPA: hypothetical protein VJV03_07520 [Pyrinomonadaceae bacterium]|nr:hypothetical protein [Pyrinomonadaceae bacterium]